jgi:hypothetical protein
MKRRIAARGAVAALKEISMIPPSALLRLAAASVAALAAAAIAPAAQAQSVRVVHGQAFWTGDPHVSDAGSFWSSGQYRYDPHHYLDYYGSEPANFSNVVYAEHSGRAHCVFRKRVENSNWEHQNPYLMVCRP